MARRLALVAVGGDRTHLQEFLDGYKLGFPASVAAKTAGPAIWMEQKIHKANPDVGRADVARVAELIDHVDELIAGGVIGGEQPNAADFQIAPSVRLLMALDQLRPLIDGRPAAELALTVVSDFRGRVPAGLPHDWLPKRPAASA